MIENKRQRWKVQTAAKDLRNLKGKLYILAMKLDEAADQPFCDDPADSLFDVEDDLRNMRQDLSAVCDKLAEVRNAIEEGSSEEN